MVMKQHGNSIGWKVQTAISLMLRLVERGFLRTEKIGKERTYFPLVRYEDYLTFETSSFLKQFHNNSFFNLIAAMVDNETLTAEEISRLRKLLDEQEG
jgi:predicted transcriptional regulator